jgi:hypothetical protein
VCLWCVYWEEWSLAPLSVWCLCAWGVCLLWEFTSLGPPPPPITITPPRPTPTLNHSSFPSPPPTLAPPCRYIRIAEQNMEDKIWPEGQDWARQLPVTVDALTGSYFIHAVEEPTSSVRGWMHIVDEGSSTEGAAGRWAACDCAC